MTLLSLRLEYVVKVYLNVFAVAILVAMATLSHAYVDMEINTANIKSRSKSQDIYSLASRQVLN